MSRVFISHSSKNDDWVIALHKWLEGQGWSGKDDIFLDLDPERGIVAGERWVKALEDAATRCEAVLFLVSEAWLASKWCGDEYQLANRYNKKLFALLIDDIALDRLPGGLAAQWQVVRLRGEPAERFFTTHPLTQRQSPVHIAEAGLKSLKRGLEKAGSRGRNFIDRFDRNAWEDRTMTEKWKDEGWAQDIWYRAKVTRRRFVGWGGGAIGAMMLVPAPWRAAFGAAKPYKIGSEQSLSGAGAAGGKTALVGLQMAVDRINHMGGIMGRPIELVIADDESKPDVARRKTQKMVEEDNIDVHVGGFLSNICLACMPVWEEAKIVNMISVCLDTTLTTSKCNRYSFRVHDYAPAQAVAFGPMLAKMGKKWHIAFADYSWGQSTRDAFAAEIKKNGGEVVGTTGIPLGTADMTPFLSKISGDFDGLFGIFFGKDGVTIGNQAYDLGLTKKYKWAGDGAICESVNLPALGNKIDGFVAINRYIPIFEGALDTPYHHRFFDEAKKRLAKIDQSGPLPDRYVQSNYEAMNALKHGMEMSNFETREDTMKLIEALEGLEMKLSDDFPQGDKTLRKADHQAFLNEFLYTVKGGQFHLLEMVPKDKTIVPSACKFAAT